MAKKIINTVKKILLVRPEMMGDTILLTPIASLIKKHFPKAEIYMLIQPPMQEVIKNNNDIAGYLLTKKKLGFFEYMALVKKIRNSKFDVSIVFEDNPAPEYALLCLLAGIRNRIGDRSRLLYGWMYNHGAWVESIDPKLHHIELYLKLLEPLGIKEEYLPLKIIPDNIEKSGLQEKLIGIHIGTGGGNKALLAETYAKISDALQEKTNCKVIFTGGKREIDTAKKIQSFAKKPYTDLVDKTSIQELFSTIKNLDLFIGVDSGPLHAAAAFNIPIVAIYTAKDVNPTRWFPWMSRNIIIKSQTNCTLKCQHRECKYDHCIRSLAVGDITDAAVKLLKGDGNKTIEETRKSALS